METKTRKFINKSNTANTTVSIHSANWYTWLFIQQNAKRYSYIRHV